MKRALYLFCGLCWLAFGLFIGLFLFQYLAVGAGLWDSGYAFLIFAPSFSSGTVLIGFIHVIGLFMLFAVLSVIGLGFCLRAFEPEPDLKESKTRLPPAGWN